MAESKIKKVAQVEWYANNHIRLIRIGNVRILSGDNFKYGTDSFTLPAEDRAEFMSGSGTKDANGNYTEPLRVWIHPTVGTLNFQLIRSINTAASYVAPTAGDMLTFTVVWAV